MPHDQALQFLQSTLDELSNRRIGIDAFFRSWRSQSGLLSALPTRYAQVMEDLLGRIESGSLFSEESCSFSHEDMQSSLSAWLDKAKQHLGRQS